MPGNPRIALLSPVLRFLIFLGEFRQDQDYGFEAHDELQLGSIFHACNVGIDDKCGVPGIR